MMPRPLLCCAVLLLFLMSSSATSSTIPTTVLSYEIKVCVRNEGARPLDVKMAIPFLPLFPNTTWQTALVLNASHPLMEIISDEDGNPGLLLNVSVILEPGENLTLTAEYKIISKYREPPNVIFEQSGRISDIPEQLASEFCCETGCWTINFKPLRELAFNLTGGERNVLKVISSFIIWIYENVVYHPFETPLYPNETYVNKMGAYDDQVNLLITLCRSVGIPAYLQIGYVFVPNHQDELLIGAGHMRWKLTNICWHAWAVAYVPPWGWLPIDLTVIGGAVIDPLDVIRKALIWDQHTLLLAEIKHIDYVAAAREAVEFLRKHGIYIYREERLDFWKGEEDILAVLWPFLMASSVMLPISFIAVLMAMRLRRRSGGGRPSDRASLTRPAYPAGIGLLYTSSHIG